MCEYWETAYHELDAKYVELARKYEAIEMVDEFRRMAGEQR